MYSLEGELVIANPLWIVGILKSVFPARFAFARATRLPILGHLVDRWLFHGDDVIFLPQDEAARTVLVGEAVDRPAEVVLPSRVVEHFVERAKVHWIMDFCLCRSAAGCQDYPVELGCLFLGEAALKINPALGRRVTRAEAMEHVKRAREAGLIHMVGRNKLDTVWLGAGPGRQLLTICNCCPCCCLWRVLPHMTERIGAKIQRMPGVSVTVSDDCTGCGVCTEQICFVDAISLQDGKAVIDDSCRGCGRCVTACPYGAIELSIEDPRFVERAIAHLGTLVDVD